MDLILTLASNQKGNTSMSIWMNKAIESGLRHFGLNIIFTHASAMLLLHKARNT
jgi:hypothetical protein